MQAGRMARRFFVSHSFPSSRPNCSVTLRHSTIALIAFVAGCSAPRPSTKNTEAAADSTKPSVRITQFYPATPHIGKGDRAALCYGVEGASDVRLTPPVEQLWPTISRCFEVKPATTTTYTLTALDASGHSVTEKTTIDVGPPSAARDTKPSGARFIKEVVVSKLEVTRGEEVTICYTANKATSVTIHPGQGTNLTGARGCVTDKPSKTTIYQVVATGPGGQTDTEHVSVKVR
jgi:hypothetical protein